MSLYCSLAKEKKMYFMTAIFQIALFTLVPFLWWLVSARKEYSFFDWLGLKRIKHPRESKVYLWIICTLTLFSALSIFILYVMRDIETATSDFADLGAKALFSIAIYAILKTSLSEEILFRGFLLKRLSHRFGFAVANLIQSILFGLLHGVMFFRMIDTWQTVLIVGLTGGIAWLMGFINEKKAEGSILPSWMIHAAANFLSGICTAFSLFG